MVFSLFNKFGRMYVCLWNEYVRSIRNYDLNWRKIYNLILNEISFGKHYNKTYFLQNDSDYLKFEIENLSVLRVGFVTAITEDIRVESWVTVYI